MQRAESEIAVVSVSRLANFIAGQLRNNAALRRVAVRGEVSNASVAPTGHLYFTLKDRDAALACVVWAETAARLPIVQNGQSVIAYGGITTFAKQSRYQLDVSNVELEGVGRLHQRYEQLKAKLAAEGLFDAKRKRALPKFPFRIALVSSPRADGANDFRQILARRSPHVDLVFIPTPVQGDAAAAEIVSAIDRASQMDVDLVVVARGGGSFEDLFVFSNESVVRAFVRCQRPTVAAIGHHADTPLVDFVADFRAETPSAAAEKVVPETAMLQRRINELLGAMRPQRALAPWRQRVDLARADLAKCGHERLARAERQLVALERRLRDRDPSARLAQRAQRFAVLRDRLAALPPRLLDGRVRVVNEMNERLRARVRQANLNRGNRLLLLETKLEGRDPTAILQRGYAIVRYEGKAVRDAAALPTGAVVHAQVAHGAFTARVEDVSSNGGDE